MCNAKFKLEIEYIRKFNAASFWLQQVEILIDNYIQYNIQFYRSLRKSSEGNFKSNDTKNSFSENFELGCVTSKMMICRCISLSIDTGRVNSIERIKINDLMLNYYLSF